MTGNTTKRLKTCPQGNNRALSTTPPPVVLPSEIIEHIFSFLRTFAELLRVVVACGWTESHIVRYVLSYSCWWNKITSHREWHIKLLYGSLREQRLACFQRVYNRWMVFKKQDIHHLCAAGPSFIAHVLHQHMEFYAQTSTFFDCFKKILEDMFDSPWAETCMPTIHHTLTQHPASLRSRKLRQIFMHIACRSVHATSFPIINFALDMVAHIANQVDHVHGPYMVLADLIDFRFYLAIRRSSLTRSFVKCFLQRVLITPRHYQVTLNEDLISVMQAWAPLCADVEAMHELSMWFIRTKENIDQLLLAM